MNYILYSSRTIETIETKYFLYQISKLNNIAKIYKNIKICCKLLKHSKNNKGLQVKVFEGEDQQLVKHRVPL